MSTTARTPWFLVAIFLTTLHCDAFLVSPSQLVTRGTGSSIARSSSSLSDHLAFTRAPPARCELIRPLQAFLPLGVGPAAYESNESKSRSSGSRRSLARDLTTRRSSDGVALTAMSEAEGGGEGELQDLSSLRRNVVLAVWLCLVCYVASSTQAWSPVPAIDTAQDFDLIRDVYNGGNALFFAVFNGLGMIAFTLASTLIGGGSFGKGRQPVPPQPFVFGAFGLGFFAAAPYLALRNYLPQGDGEEPSALEAQLTSKFNGASILAVAIYCYAVGLPALADPAVRQGYANLFHSSAVVHISTIDIFLLSIFYVDPLREDMQRRGYTPDAAKVALFSVPVIGPAAWLLVRPAVLVNDA